MFDAVLCACFSLWVPAAQAPCSLAAVGWASVPFPLQKVAAGLWFLAAVGHAPEFPGGSALFLPSGFVSVSGVAALLRARETVRGPDRAACCVAVFCEEAREGGFAHADPLGIVGRGPEAAVPFGLAGRTTVVLPTCDAM